MSFRLKAVRAWVTGLFRRKEKALVFVDYEYWYFSYRSQLGVNPELDFWYHDVTDRYPVEQVMVFGDFSLNGLYEEYDRVCGMTENVIRTENESAYYKKDMTDFVMLDYIYQAVAERRDITTYILFTGDGHFHSVVKYLLKKKKKVVIYGVHNTFSKKLQQEATEAITLPFSGEPYRECVRWVIEDLGKSLDKMSNIPTLRNTMERVARQHNVPESLPLAVILKMREHGYIRLVPNYVGLNKTVSRLSVDWTRLISEGLWDLEEQRAK